MPKDSYNELSSEELEYVDDKTAALLLNTPHKARVMLWVMLLFFIFAVIWASFAEIDKMTVGQGKVVPSSQIQVIQNLEGGLVKEILVREGQHVKKGQQLLLLDETRFLSDFREREQDLANLQATAIELSASIDSVVISEVIEGSDWQKSVIISYDKLEFPEQLEQEEPRLVSRQKAQYRQELDNLRNKIAVVDEQVKQKRQELVELKSRVNNQRASYNLVKQELNITKPLADEGVVPLTDFLKLQRQVNDAQRELSTSRLKIPSTEAMIRESLYARIETAQKFRSEQQQKLNQAQDKLSSSSESAVGLEDKVNRTVITSPVNGTVNALYANTVGGVIKPGMDIADIVPSEDNLLIEARIAPQDIAFLRPELTAVVKFSAYDFTKFGGLPGSLEYIGADTQQDEEGNSYYLVRVRTFSNSLNTNGELPIIPGMTASVDIITGKRTVMEYLLGPILSAKKNSLRE
ncbi:HlyD family type I secretion periplasmic adaptor subunit [Vibrio sp. RC27]